MSTPPKPRSSDTVPALVMGQGMTLLGTLRGLADASIPSFTADVADLRDSTRWSRWFRRCPGAPLRWDTPEALADGLARSPLDGAVLIPCADSAAVAVASLPAELRTRFPTSCSSADVQMILADKLRFASVLQRLEIPHPETIAITSRSVIEDIPEADLTRFFIKPQDSESFSKRYGIKACLLRDKAHALHKHDWLADGGLGVMLQEFIQGPATRHVFVDGFVDRRGRVRARFARQRLRMEPPSLGNSTCLVSIPLAEVADACGHLDRLFADLGFRGIFSAEFKRDPRDGVCKLLEVNARPWWFIGFARACGVNVAAMAYHDALDHDVPEITGYPAGRYCVYQRSDLKAGLRELREGTLDHRRWATAWLRGVKPVFAWNDPGPMVCEVSRLVPKAFRILVPGRKR